MSLHNFTKTFKTELIKKKRSGIFTLSIILGVLLPLVGTIIILVAEDNFNKNSTPINYYFNHLKNYIIPYASFLLPLLIIITASKTAQIDHKNKGWDLMETQPISKFLIYFSKYILLTISNIISILTFIISTLLLSWIATAVKTPEAHFDLSVPFLLFSKVTIRLFIASISITAIQYVLSVLIRSFIWPIIIGFSCLILPLALKPFNISLFWFPYQFINGVGANPTGSDLNNWFIYSDYLSILFAFLFLFIGYNYYKLKTTLNTFWHPKSNLLKTLGVLLFFSASTFTLLQPIQLEKHNRTVLKGTISSDKTIEYAYLFDKTVGDTIAKMPIKNNSFSHYFTENISADYYDIIFDRYGKHDIFFSNNDSINIDYKNYGNKKSISFKGTRLAEHQQNKNSSSYIALDYYLENNIRLENADFYMKSIYENWQKELAKLSNTRTIDNIIPRNDYMERTKKQLALKYITYWNQFKKKRKALYPNKEYIINKDISLLVNSISLNDENLLSDGYYLQYISENLIENDHRKINQDQKYLDAISKLERSVFKDRLLHRQLKKSISEIENISERDSIFNIYIKHFSKPSYVSLLEKTKFNLNRLSKGIIAPNLEAYSSDNKSYTLDDFKGKHVIIDVWASWCGPCKREAPFFEKAALSLEDKPITFISLSVDRKEADWLVDIKNNSDATLQLRTKNALQFMNNYNLNRIPRFILINPEGLIEDVEFTRPSNKKFEEFLNNYLK